VHRVAEIVFDTHAGKTIIRAKGDANPSSISSLDYPIYQQNYIGKMVYVVPQFGIITHIFSPPVNYIIIACGLIVVVYFIRKLPAIKKIKSRQTRLD
jgi:signal peptidase